MNALNEMTLVRLNPGLRILVETTSISHNRAVLEKIKLSGFDSLWMFISFSMSTGHNGLLSIMALKWTCQGASCLHFKRLFLIKTLYSETPLTSSPIFIIWRLQTSIQKMGGGRGQESEESRIIYFPSPGDKNGKLLIRPRGL